MKKKRHLCGLFAPAQDPCHGPVQLASGAQAADLGCYSKIEDAVKARAYAKDMVREDAEKLQLVYEQLHKNDPPRPSRKKTKANVGSGLPEETASR